MAHFVGCHQWVFFQLPTKTTQSQYTSEVTLNQQALMPCDDGCNTLMQANFLDIAMEFNPQ